MVLLNLITPTAVSVAWVQPSRGATVTGYVVHYTSDGTTDRMKSVAASSTSTDITGLTSGLTYTISVEATSEHLSGESKDRTIAVGEYILVMCMCLLHCFSGFMVSQSSQYIYISYRDSTRNSSWCDCE